jgi:hypothetical protein
LAKSNKQNDLISKQTTPARPFDAALHDLSVFESSSDEYIHSDHESESSDTVEAILQEHQEALDTQIRQRKKKVMITELFSIV